MDFDKAIDMTKIFSALTYRFGARKMAQYSEILQECIKKAKYVDSDELIDYIGDYCMEYHNYEPTDIADENELEQFILATAAHKELKRNRGFSIWDIKRIYLSNNNIDINDVDINGLDVEHDFEELNHLALWGHIEAIEKIALFYASPGGGSKDEVCVQYWTIAANFGSVKSQKRLAQFYLWEIRGLKFNPEKVIYYYKCAANQGDQESIDFVNKHHIDIDSPTISKKEIDSVIQEKMTQKKISPNKDGFSLEDLGGIVAIGYIIYEVYNFFIK
ncbi:hypothetical protein [uncultured Haemophilus sp.]|uniref:hypothetical protein n=1 Tax=uncultured Haemophilus sp. TaxID=237779 RepID=UPI0025846DEC|nr:hypothetical protein [uncultured Haemophilus sp.]